jgi:hypothetical protein
MTLEQLRLWLEKHPLSPIDIDCVVTVMLKILDGKCKMQSAEKTAMTQLYDQVKFKAGLLLEETLHPLIAKARESENDEALKMLIYEKRLLAETAISRPVMKRFKAMIRKEGLLEQTGD